MLKDVESTRKDLLKSQGKYYTSCKEIDKIEKDIANLKLKYGPDKVE